MRTRGGTLLAVGLLFGFRNLFFWIIMTWLFVQFVLPIFNPYLIESNEVYHLERMRESGVYCSNYVDKQLIINCEDQDGLRSYFHNEGKLLKFDIEHGIVYSLPNK
jgi:hypothetical protein